MSTRIKEILSEKGITMKELAEKIGASQTGLCVALGPKGNPTLHKLEKIAKALDVPLISLFEAPASAVATCPHCGKPVKVELSCC